MVFSELREENFSRHFSENFQISSVTFFCFVVFSVFKSPKDFKNRMRAELSVEQSKVSLPVFLTRNSFPRFLSYENYVASIYLTARKLVIISTSPTGVWEVWRRLFWPIFIVVLVVAFASLAKTSSASFINGKGNLQSEENTSGWRKKKKSSEWFTAQMQKSEKKSFTGFHVKSSSCSSCCRWENKMKAAAVNFSIFLLSRKSSWIFGFFF